MLNLSKGPHHRRMPVSFFFGAIIATSVLAAILLMQSACSKKVKTEAVSSSSPVRLVLLPFNVPSGDQELRWAAMAAPILMAKAGEKTPGLEIIPLWQSMPTALNAAGPSRAFTEQSAANVASWMSAKWSVLGELAPAKTGVSMVVDFVPARANVVPFRYLKAGKLDAIGASFYDAYVQFLRYLVAKPFQPEQDNEMTMTSVKDLAEALDREYGWSAEAEPGKAQEIVASLVRSNEQLARALFSPTLYPSLAEKKKEEN
jgi:hypothetical protein